MAIAVGDNDLAALLREVYGVIIAGFIFGDIVLVDHLAFVNAQGSDGGLDALDMGQVIARVLIVDQDDADLQICSRNRLTGRTAAGICGGLFRSGLLCGGFFGGRFFCGRGFRGFGGGGFRRFRSCRLTGAGHHTQGKNQGQGERKKFLHLLIPPLILPLCFIYYAFCEKS